MSEEPLHLYVWSVRFLYVGPSIATTAHRNHAAAWLVSSDGPLCVTLADGTILENEAIFIPSDTEYSTAATTARIAALYWEPESASFRAATTGADNIPRAFRCPLAGSAANQQLSNPSTTLEEADRLLATMFGVGIDDRTTDPRIDPRVASSLAFLRESPEQYGSLDALAERVHLSPSRFAHVFKDAIGVPVRRYLLWQKMRRALDFAIAGHSLTTAALSAGFADSAHLSRTVRAMLGIAPEFLFRQRERLVIHR